VPEVLYPVTEGPHTGVTRAGYAPGSRSISPPTSSAHPLRRGPPRHRPWADQQAMQDLVARLLRPAVIGPPSRHRLPQRSWTLARRLQALPDDRGVSADAAAPRAQAVPTPEPAQKQPQWASTSRHHLEHEPEQHILRALHGPPCAVDTDAESAILTIAASGQRCPWRLACGQK
jgi:hypothetical protein